ncbi:MAG: hypothetical protein JNK45_00490 [Myxococcales bacterium]|nr:hypothetical protein [Myxococcales bacterium]
MVLDVTQDRLQASWWLVDDVTSPEGGAERFAAAWSVVRGTVALLSDAEPAPPPAESPAPAP